jgi:hypothetical protein
MPLDPHPVGSKVLPHLLEELSIQQGPGTSDLEQQERPLTYLGQT